MDKSKRTPAKRLTSFLLMGFLFGTYVHHDYSMSFAYGRQAFLNKEGIRFDRFIATQPSLLHVLVRYAIAAVFSWMIFELISWLLMLPFRSRHVEMPNQ